jgi:hypothetical protein
MKWKVEGMNSADHLFARAEFEPEIFDFQQHRKFTNHSLQLTSLISPLKKVNAEKRECFPCQTMAFQCQMGKTR